MSEDHHSAIETYGALKEGSHLAGYSFERVCKHLEWMLEGERWQLAGQFQDVNDFLDSLRFGDLRASTDTRKRIAQRIKELQPTASNRQIARTVGVSHTTVGRDVGTNVPTAEEKDNKNNGQSAQAGTNVPPESITGERAAKLAFDHARREVEAQQARERARPRAEDSKIVGCSVADLEQLAASGYRAGVILADPPWPFATWSHVGLAGDSGQENRAQRSRAAPYKTMAHEKIYALPIEALAADDCVLFLWVVQTQLPQAFEVVQRWGFQMISVAFSWVKGEESDDVVVPMGCGYWTRAGFEQCWLATRGNPRRLYADVRQVIMEKRRDHSRKPDCARERIERLAAGPYLEVFARQLRDGWTCWGDEISRQQFEQTAKLGVPG